MNDQEKLGMAIENMRDGMMIVSNKHRDGWIVVRTGQTEIVVKKSWGIASLADAIKEMSDR